MQPKLFNDFIQKEFEILNARNFLITFYNEKATTNFDISDDTKSLLKDMFYLFKEEYSLKCLNVDNILENEELASNLLNNEPSEIPFGEIDEKEFKQLVKLSRLTEKMMTRTLDIKQNTLFKAIYGFWTAETAPNKINALIIKLVLKMNYAPY